MLYCLYDNAKERRLVIDCALGDGASINTVEASCWLDAKQKLGFELTALQSYFLERANAKEA